VSRYARDIDRVDRAETYYRGINYVKRFWAVNASGHESDSCKQRCIKHRTLYFYHLGLTYMYV